MDRWTIQTLRLHDSRRGGTYLLSAAIYQYHFARPTAQPLLALHLGTMCLQSLSTPFWFRSARKIKAHATRKYNHTPHLTVPDIPPDRRSTGPRPPKLPTARQRNFLVLLSHWILPRPSLRQTLHPRVLPKFRHAPYFPYPGVYQHLARRNLQHNFNPRYCAAMPQQPIVRPVPRDVPAPQPNILSGPPRRVLLAISV
jgi:hypothetical protein